MTRKEEAIELVRKYGVLGFKWESTGFETLNIGEAKECALIAVDMLIRETAAKKWYEIKIEIEKL